MLWFLWRLYCPILFIWVRLLLKKNILLFFFLILMICLFGWDHRTMYTWWSLQMLTLVFFQCLSIKWEGSKVIPLFSASEDKFSPNSRAFTWKKKKINEKFMRDGSLHLFAKYLRECGSVVWVVGIISRVHEVCAKLYLVVSFLL